jgi:single-strand DNA-binding protein
MENLAILLGNVGNKPEVREVGDKKVANFSLATNKTFKKGNEKVTETAWHSIVCWSPLAEVVENYVDKGSKLYISGEIQYRSYENKDGQTVYVTEIIARRLQMLDSKSTDSLTPKGEKSTQDVPKSQIPAKSEPDIQDAPPPGMDDLPF